MKKFFLFNKCALFILFFQQLLLCTSAEHKQLLNRIAALEQQLSSSATAKQGAAISHWRKVQEKVQDTVVQIFAQFIEVDMLHPYKAPAQFPTFASGFFINDAGEIVTNAHAVEQAAAVWVQIPSLGKRIIQAEVVGLCPERDLALLRVCATDLACIKEELGRCPFLPLGNSDLVHRADEVMALGYPLAQQSLKSTTGVISGREHQLIQMSAAINPGSSGGPLLNTQGEVIGINTSGFQDAQNVGYIIPVNDLKNIVDELRKTTVLGKPFLGVFLTAGNKHLTAYLGNPLPGGCDVVSVIKNSLMDKIGLHKGDMLYEINGHALDFYGDLRMPGSEEKISIVDYIAQLRAQESVHLVAYRKGERKDFTFIFDNTSLATIHRVLPVYEPIEYEIIAGMVVMPLALNHVSLLLGQAPGLALYTVSAQQTEPALIITHVFPTSQLGHGRVAMPGMIIKKVNDVSVKTVAEFSAAVKQEASSTYLTIEVIDNSSLACNTILLVLSYEEIRAQEPVLARDFRYPLSDLARELCEKNSNFLKEKKNEIFSSR